MTRFGEQIIDFLEHLDVGRVVLGGTSLGANVTLEVAQANPERLRGMLLEMPALDNGVEAGILTFAPLLFFGRFLPFTVHGIRRATRLVPRRLVPFWTGIALDTLDQQPAAMAALVHGVFFGRVAPSAIRRRRMTTPALVIAHPRDPLHPAGRRCDARRRAAECTVRGGGVGVRVAYPSGTHRRVRLRVLDGVLRPERPYAAPPPSVYGPARNNGEVRLYRDDGIVLRTHPLGEADRIVTILTRFNGRVRAVAKGVRRTRSKFGSRLDPFTHIDVQFALGRSLDIVAQVETIRSYREPVVADYRRYTAGTAMLETAERLVVEEKEPAVQQHQLLLGGLRALAGDMHDASLVLDSFVLRSLAIAGYAPSFDGCARCEAPGPHRSFNPAGGGMLCAQCRQPGGATPGPDVVSLLGGLLAGDWELVDSIDARHRSAASGIVAAYLEWHVERSLRSLAYVER